MGGGDLNMKKSWHPLLIKNQERVWKEEQKAAEEQKKLEQLRKEKEEERQLQELRRLQEEAGGKKGIERLEWMYAAGPNQSSSGQAQEMEEYLLGKKRIDSLITQGNTVSQLSNQSTDIFISAMNPNANTYRDTQAKIREDPLLAIKKMEQDTIKSIVTNPIKMKELKKASFSVKSKKEKNGKKHKDKKDKSEKDNRERRSRNISPSPYRMHRSEDRNHSSEKDNRERHNRDRSP
ncbi:12180_t:CDS:2, partial [Ambispora leptoticha]